MADKRDQVARTRNQLSRQKQNRFLAALAERHLNVSAACRLAKISYPSVYKQRAMDPQFKREWEEIKDEILDDLEEDQYKDAKKNPEDRRWILARQRKDAWSDKSQVSVTGQVEHVHSVGEIPAATLERLIKERFPDAGDLVEAESIVEERPAEPIVEEAPIDPEN